MAEHDLIDAYVAQLRRSLRRQAHVDDVVAEVEDHLREVVAAHVRCGMDEHTAERHAVGQFGSAELVTRAFVSSSGGSIAMSTTVTRAAGLVAMFGGVLLFIVLALGSVTDLDVGGHSGWFAPLATTALAMALVGVAGLHLRHRAVYSGSGRIGRWLIPAGVIGAVGGMLTWFAPGVLLGVLMVAVGLLLVGIDVWTAGVVDRRALGLIGVGFPSAMIAAAVGGGGIDWTTILSIVAIGGLALGVAWLGYNLWREQPDAARPPTATA